MRVAVLLAAAPVLVLSIAFTACGGSTKKNGTAPQNDAASDDGGDAGDDATDDASPIEAGPVDAGPDVDHGHVSNQYPAPHPPLPILETNGGPTLGGPKVWLIFYDYQNNPYPYEAQIQAFAQALAGSTTYWPAMTSEYGVGQITYAGFTDITDEAPPSTISDQGVQQWMQQKIGANTFGGPPDPSTIYTIVYPASTTITLQNGQSCQAFGGYHSNTSVGGSDVPYAVLPTCNNFDGLTGADAVTGPMSHEWSEAATDPYPMSNPAYSGVDAAHVVWQLFGGGENGDLCISSEPNPFFRPADLTTDAGGSFAAQRTWSNILAKASHDPCAPDLPNEVYFNSAPVLADNIMLNFGGGIQTKGVRIPVGQQKTIEVDLFSDGPTGVPWQLQAQDALATQMGTTPTMKFSWDKPNGQNGEKRYLTITVTRATQFGAGVAVILSEIGLRYATWPILVGEQ